MMRLRLPPRAKVLTSVAATAMVGLGAVGAMAASTAAAQSRVRSEVSENWAGYVVTGKNFSSVSGAWNEPSVKASSSSSATYAAVWVGLGGHTTSSSSLEQVGTSADYVDGHAEYYAWYELLPSAQVKLNIAVHPGDKISARVSVAGTSVTIALSDQTTGHSVVKTLHMSHPDTSSAEWIVEAPATQIFGGSYQVLPLADFAKVAFSKVTATAAGYEGGIADSHWSAARIQLRAASGFGFTSGPASLSAGPSAGSEQSGEATTSTLSADTFSVSWRARSATPATSGSQPAIGQYPGAGGPFPVGASGYGPVPAYPDGGVSSGL